MILRPLALALSLAIALPMTANAQTPADIAIASPQGTLLSVSSSADATRVPDIATISTGVVTQAADANAAMRANVLAKRSDIEGAATWRLIAHRIDALQRSAETMIQ